MNVKTLSEEIIKPSSQTPPHHPKTYKVSLLDQFSPSSYIPFILFYKNNHQEYSADQTLSHLKESFSKTLAIYYPLAGRFKDTATIDCNDEGGLHIEAKINSTLSEFLKKPDIQFLNNFLPCKGNGLEKDRIPLVAAKITLFKCGGIVLGACLFHKVVDAVASSAFLNTWAKISRGEKFIEPDFSSASTLFPPRNLSDDFVRNFDNFFFQGTKSYMRRYLFDTKAVTDLRAKTASENVPNPSRVQALSAFITERLSWASKEAKSSTFSTLMITHAVNLRPRIEPPLPDSSFGNIIWLAFAFYEIDLSSDSDHKINLSDLVEILREAFAGLNKESIPELGTDDAFNALSELLESVCTNENIKMYRFTTANNMGLYDVDFGWGKPVWVAHMGDMVGYRSKQQFVFMEATSGKGLELWLASDEAELSILEKDPEFLEYAIPNPSISIE
ncbi:hypothetical protein ACH5RR_019376 [Cinchona calisaya]|uniref:Uncharacterized protein n=1 Tax=Cinchona calisaya TaxID=153742 RepID=A0ABD2ZS11_9GENT